MIAANQKDSLIARSRSLRWQEIDRKQRIAKRDARHVSANAVVIQTLQTVPGLLHNPFVLVAATVESSGERNQEHSGKALLETASREGFYWPA